MSEPTGEAIDRLIKPLVERYARDAAATEERLLEEILRHRFRPEAFTVLVRKPRWMPERMYHWLMRTIVVTKET